MSKLALIVTVEFEPGLKDEVLQALLTHRERCLKEEPGTLLYEVLVPLEEPAKLLLFELYSDSSAFSAHTAGRSIAHYRDDVRGKIRSVTSYKCSVDGASASWDASATGLLRTTPTLASAPSRP